MKRTFYSIFSLVLLAGCSSEVPYQDSPTKEAVPLVISSIRIDSDVSTRATDIPLREGTLGIFQTGGSSYIPAPYQYTGIEGGWNSSAPLILGPEEALVCAWFPYDYFLPSAMSDLAHFPLQAQVYTQESDLAFLTTTGGIDSQNQSLNIRLTHAYALLSFTLSRDITYKGEGVITGITFDNEKLVRAEMIDIRDGSFSDQEVIRSLSLGLSAIVTAGKTTTIAILVPPHTFTDTQLTLQVDGKSLSGTLSGSSIGELHSGMSRTFDVTLRSDLKLSVTVLPVDGSVGGEIIW